MADVVGHDDVEFGGVERLAGPEQFACEDRVLKIRPAAGRSMQNQDGVANHTLLVALRLTQRAVMNLQLRQRLAGIEPKILDDEIPRLRVGGAKAAWQYEKQKR